MSKKHKKKEALARRNLRGAAQETLAMGLVGDGIIAAAMPERHVMLWEFGPSWQRRAVRWTAQRPWLVRMIALTEAAAAAFWIWRLTACSAKAS